MNETPTTIAHVLLREMERAQEAGSGPRLTAALNLAARLGASRQGYNDHFSQLSRMWMPDGSRLEFIKDQHGRVTANCAGTRPEEDAPTGIVLLSRGPDTGTEQPGCNLEDIKTMFDEAQETSPTEPRLEQVAAAEVNYLNATRRMEAAKTAEMERQALERLTHLAETGECRRAISPDTLREVVCDLDYITEKTVTMDEATRLIAVMWQRTETEDAQDEVAPES